MTLLNLAVTEFNLYQRASNFEELSDLDQQGRYFFPSLLGNLYLIYYDICYIPLYR